MGWFVKTRYTKDCGCVEETKEHDDFPTCDTYTILCEECKRKTVKEKEEMTQEAEMKTCSKCRHKKDIDMFEEGLKTCNPCREKGKEKRKKTFYCELCDFEGKLEYKAKHEKTQRHQAQLKRQHNSDIPKLPEPDDVWIDDNGKKYFFCKKCNGSVMNWYWERHINICH